MLYVVQMTYASHYGRIMLRFSLGDSFLLRFERAEHIVGVIADDVTFKCRSFWMPFEMRFHENIGHQEPPSEFLAVRCNRHGLGFARITPSERMD